MEHRADSVRVARPLFQAESDGSTPISALAVKSMRVVPIPYQQALALNRKWHSRLPRMGTGFIKNQPFLSYGAEAPGGVLYAVAIWSNPVARNLPQGTWLELRRLAASPDAPRNLCSWMLGIMARLVHRERPGLERLVSYQDTAVHKGTIYKAAGWTAVLTTRGDEWDHPGRPRPKAQTTAPKVRWELAL
jgi:hypothetical protein